MPVYDYTDNGIPDDALVDTDSPGFLERVNWLLHNSPARSWEPGEEFGVGIAGNAYIRGNITFFGDEGRSILLDAYLTDRKPNVSLPIIYSELAPGQPLPSPFPAYNATPPPAVDPVGAKWPQKGPNIWHVSEQYVAADWPSDSSFTKKDETGLDRTFYPTTVRGVRAASGTVGGGATWVPAWTDSKRA